MSLIACRECAHLVSSEATACPRCGCPSKPAPTNAVVIAQAMEPLQPNPSSSAMTFIAMILSHTLEVMRIIWRPQLWIASLMAVLWTVFSVALIIHLAQGVNEVRPLVKEATDFIAPRLDQTQHWVDDISQRLFNELAQKREDEARQKNLEKQLAEQKGNIALVVSQARAAGLTGEGPFVGLPAPPDPTLSSPWEWTKWKWRGFQQEIQDVKETVDRFNQAYGKAKEIEREISQAVQSTAEAVVAATKRIGELHDRSRTYQALLDSPLKQPSVIADIRQSPWLGTVLVILHATLIPITVALALSSLLRVMVLAERLTPVRLVSE